MRGTGWTPSMVPNGHDQTFYLVINNYGKAGAAFAETDLGEADLETSITDLMSGQYNEPVRVVAFQHRRTLVRGCLGGCRAGNHAPSRSLRA
jgi:hypothetical protein